MAQKYYEYANYKLEHVQEQQRAPRGAYNSYIVAFQTVFYAIFYVRALLKGFFSCTFGVEWDVCVFPIASPCLLGNGSHQ